MPAACLSQPVRSLFPTASQECLSFDTAPSIDRSASHAALALLLRSRTAREADFLTILNDKTMGAGSRRDDEDFLL